MLLFVLIYIANPFATVSSCLRGEKYALQVASTDIRPVVSVLGSRDQLCVKPEVKNAPSNLKTAMCHSLVKKSKCEFFTGSESMFIFYKDFMIRREAKSSIMDIEDMIKFGEKSWYLWV
jgi:regulator of telomere elongation helicase 1